MPDPGDIAARLGVSGLPGDALTVEDLGSAKRTRMGMQREMIKRRPGIYTRHWLAERLGVCVETIDSYNRAIPLHMQPMFIEQPISWATLYAVPEDEPPPNLFLCDGRGNRYPALRGIAARLLQKRQSVRLMRQTGNFYWYGHHQPDISIRQGVHPDYEAHQAQFKRIAEANAAAVRHKRQTAAKAKDDAFAAKIRAASEKIQADAAAAAKLSPHLPISARLPGEGEEKHPHPPISSPLHKEGEKINAGGGAEMPRPLPGFGDKAIFVAADPQWLYEKVQDMSLKTAHELVKTYSGDEIYAALRVLQSRQNIVKATGFLIMLLRSNRKGKNLFSPKRGVVP